MCKTPNNAIIKKKYEQYVIKKEWPLQNPTEKDFLILRSELAALCPHFNLFYDQTYLT